jgi:hypothetical protein
LWFCGGETASSGHVRHPRRVTQRFKLQTSHLQASLLFPPHIRRPFFSDDAEKNPGTTFPLSKCRFGGKPVGGLIGWPVLSSRDFSENNMMQTIFD